MSCFTKNTSCFRYFIYNMVNIYFHVKLESMYILKNLVGSTCFISVSFILIFVFLFVFFLVLKRIMFFLCLEKVLFVCCHRFTFLNSLLRVSVRILISVCW